MILYFDIETLPTDNQEVIAELNAEGEEAKASVKAPSNYKDEAKIAEYISAKQAEIDAETADKIHRTGLSGMFGRIACICYAFDDGPVFEVSTVNSTEREMLEHFYSHVYDVASVEHHAGFSPIDLTVCGHNIAGFDLPFMKQRSIVNRVRPIQQFRKAFDAKPWDSCIADTMRMWSGDLKAGGSMDKLCRAFGLPGKGDFDGSMVAATWPTDPQKVIDYCKADVQRTRLIYKRLTYQLNEAAQQAAQVIEAAKTEPVAPVAEKPADQLAAKVIQAIEDTGATIKLGEICSRLGFTVTADFLSTLGFQPVKTEKAARLYKESSFPLICGAIARHVTAVAAAPVKLAA